MSTEKLKFFRVIFMENLTEKPRVFYMFQHIVVKILTNTSSGVLTLFDT